MWGFSKDMGLSGFRMSVLVTKNKRLHTVLNELIHFCEVPSSVQSFATNVDIVDTDDDHVDVE